MTLFGNIVSAFACQPQAKVKQNKDLGELAMPGVRLNGFLASTAVALLLSVSGSALADPVTPPPGETAATPTPDSAAPAAAAAEPDKSTGSVGAAAGAQNTDAAPAPAAAAPASEPAVAVAPAEPQKSAEPAETPNPAAAAPAPAETGNAEPAAPAPAQTGTAEPTPAAPAPAQTGTAEPAAAAPAPAQTGTAEPAAAAPAATATPADTQQPAANAVPASTLPAADQAVADQLRDLSSGKFDHVIGGKVERSAVEAFYSGRSYAPLWITGGVANARAKAAIDYLGHVDADGLDPADYPVADFKASDPGALAEAELRLTASVITYARHASVGRVAWSRVSADISYDQKPPEPATVLAALADAKDVAGALDSYEPHAAGYLALKAKLAEIRGGNTQAMKASIPGGPVLKVGAQDARVPQLRERLGVTGDGTTYDKDLAEAVKKFQKENDLKATGLLTPQTLDALNGPRPSHVADIIMANMERWRWMPHDLGKTYVIVNLPDYSLRVMNDGKEVWKTKIVIGKPGMPTPIMTGTMKFITINPIWHVPPSIVNREYLPALAQDPTVMSRMGLVVDHNRDGGISIWQPPGDKNALGRIRFNFPNKFLVYQHDTPDKYMFAYAKRAFSHGCMRVLNPPKYAEVLLSLVRPNDHYTIERIEKMYGPSEINIDFPTFIPVHLTYQTAFVDDAGKLELRDDVYGRDREVLALLQGPERRVADIPIEHKIDIAHRQVLAVPDSPSLWGNGGRRGYPGQAGGGGEGFFARLFGGLSQPQAPVPPRPVVRHRKVTRATRPSEPVAQ
jgi:L,D-transpeptidase YcbB